MTLNKSSEESGKAGMTHYLSVNSFNWLFTALIYSDLSDHAGLAPISTLGYQLLLTSNSGKSHKSVSQLRKMSTAESSGWVISELCVSSHLMPRTPNR